MRAYAALGSLDIGCYEIVVVGSGPGGAITACLLAEAGRNVLLIEEGNAFNQGQIPAFSLEEIQEKYRNRGYTFLVGNPKISYVEGCCVGGGSEVNSGLYHRTPNSILSSWTKDFGIEGISLEAMEPYFIANEKELDISFSDQEIPLPSQKLRNSASELGWSAEEIPRWVSNKLEGGASVIHRRAMSNTFIPRFIKAGGRLLPNTKALKIKQLQGMWRIDCQNNMHQTGSLTAKYLFLCGGAVQTPFLLKKSGIKKNIGNSFKSHPMLKVIAKFKEPVNHQNMGVPMHQVSEFLPEFTFGSSISAKPFLALGLINYPEVLKTLSMFWQNMAIYHVTIHSETKGQIYALPGVKDPIIQYAISAHDLALLTQGHARILELLFQAGATDTYSSIRNYPVRTSFQQFLDTPVLLDKKNVELSSVHIMGSCPMGIDPETSAANSFGAVHGIPNLFINDASLFCSSIGVNPQGTVMALARRNVSNFLKTL